MSSGGWILRALRLNMAAVIVTMTDGEKKKMRRLNLYRCLRSVPPEMTKTA